MIPSATSPVGIPAATSLGSKLTNIFATPAFVFEEIAQTPHRFANWLVPLVLVCVSSLLLLPFTTNKDTVADTLRGLLNKETISQAQSSTLSETWSSVSAAVACVSAAAGTFWSALVLWLIGRLFLNTSLTFGKALEIVGLTSIILVLGALVTIALVAASGDPAARPALSLMAGRLPRESTAYALLQGLDVFHLWSTAVLAIGLSRVGRVSFKESSFWVFGYWVFLRGALILLA